MKIRKYNEGTLCTCVPTLPSELAAPTCLLWEHTGTQGGCADPISLRIFRVLSLLLKVFEALTELPPSLYAQCHLPTLQ